MKLNFKILICILMSIIGINSLSNKNFFNKIKSEIKLNMGEKNRFSKIIYYENGEKKYKEIFPGKYEIILYELNYPHEIFEKNKFYNKLNKFLKNETINKKYSFLIDERFYEDMRNLKINELSLEEKVLELPASSLTDLEKKFIIKYSNNIDIKQYRGTDQEYLNRQIYILSNLLSEGNYDPNIIYSELDKEILISKLKEFRKNIIKNFENSNFEFFIKTKFYNNLYETEKVVSISKFDKNIILSNNIQDNFVFSNIKGKIYIENFPENLIEKLINEKIKLKRNILILENNKFHGYTYYDNNVIIFVNGKNPIYSYNEYEIDVNIKNIEIENITEKDSNYYILDFFK